MSFNDVANNNVPAATHPISLASINNLTVQILFTEYAAPTGLGNSVYDFYVVSAGLTEAILIRLTDDGSILVQAGPVGAATTYFGTWTPNNGSHELHFVVDSLGVATLSIDDGDAPLTPFGAFPLFLGTLPANVVAIFMSSGPAFPDSASASKVFLSPGTLPSTTEFCCS